MLHRLSWWDSRLNTTYGLSYRNSVATAGATFPGPQREELWNGYFNQSAQLLDTWSLSGAVAWEGTNIGPPTVTNHYQMASLWSPWENKIFRMTYAVAHTIPSLLNTASSLAIAPNVGLVGNSDLVPEKLTTYEVGYRSSAFGKRLQMDSSLYYTQIENVANFATKSVTFTPAPVIVKSFDNNEQILLRGFETEIKYRWSRSCSLYANYTYEHASDRQGNAGDATENTPAHKVNFGGLTDFGRGFSGSLNVGYKDRYVISSDARQLTLPVPAYWRLDARLAYAGNSRVELFLAGQNLAASTHVEFADGLVVPRTYQGGVSITLGSLP